MSQGPFLPFSRPSIDQAAIDEVVACLRSGWITSGEGGCVVTRDAKMRRDIELLRFHGIDRGAVCRTTTSPWRDTSST